MVSDDGILQCAHRLNALLCPPLGLALNALFVWLVLTKTPKEMRTHSRILLQTCILDILLLSIMTIAAPAALSVGDHHFYIVLFQGYMSNILNGPISSAYFFLVYRTVLDYQKLSISAQFLYRYFVLNRNIAINMTGHFRLLLLPIISVVLEMGVALVESPRPRDVFVDAENEQGQQPIPYGDIHLGPGQFYAIILFSSFYWLGILLFLYSLCYCVVAFCAIKMVRFVNAHAQLDERMKSLNRQLTWTLILLAAYPFFVIIAELAFHVLFRLMPEQGKTIGVQFLLSFFEYWMPIWNPVITIATNRPYREAILAMWRRGWKCAKINNNQIAPQALNKT